MHQKTNQRHPAPPEGRGREALIKKELNGGDICVFLPRTAEVEHSGPAQLFTDVTGERQRQAGAEASPRTRQGDQEGALERRSPPGPHRHHGWERHALKTKL